MKGCRFFKSFFGFLISLVLVGCGSNSNNPPGLIGEGIVPDPHVVFSDQNQKLTRVQGSFAIPQPTKIPSGKLIFVLNDQNKVVGLTQDVSQGGWELFVNGEKVPVSFDPYNPRKGTFSGEVNEAETYQLDLKNPYGIPILKATLPSKNKDQMVMNSMTTARSELFERGKNLGETLEQFEKKLSPVFLNVFELKVRENLSSLNNLATTLTSPIVAGEAQRFLAESSYLLKETFSSGSEIQRSPNPLPILPPNEGSEDPEDLFLPYILFQGGVSLNELGGYSKNLGDFTLYLNGSPLGKLGEDGSFYFKVEFDQWLEINGAFDGVINYQKLETQNLESPRGLVSEISYLQVDSTVTEKSLPIIGTPDYLLECKLNGKIPLFKKMVSPDETTIRLDLNSTAATGLYQYAKRVGDPSWFRILSGERPADFEKLVILFREYYLKFGADFSQFRDPFGETEVVLLAQRLLEQFQTIKSEPVEIRTLSVGDF